MDNVVIFSAITVAGAIIVIGYIAIKVYGLVNSGEKKHWN